MALSPSERYAEFLAGKGRRFTAHAAHVVEAVIASPGVFSGADVAAELRGQVSRATVFRTLEGLTDAGLIRPVALRDGLPVYVAAPDTG